ncbi:MAG: hypothetical protein ACXV3F_07735 [Frankiaceae bacterium]
MTLNDCKPYCLAGHHFNRPVKLHFYGNRNNHFTLAEVFYLNGTRNLAGGTYERWTF